MARLIGAVVFLVLASFLAYGVLLILSQNGASAPELTLAATGLAIGLSALAMLVAADSWRRARASQAQIRTFALSVDAALRQAATSRQTELTENAAALDLLRQEIATLGARLPDHIETLPALSPPRERRRTAPADDTEIDGAATEEAPAPKLPKAAMHDELPAAETEPIAEEHGGKPAPAKRGRRATDRAAPAEKPRPDNAAVEAAVEAALAAKRLEISLQPIIAVTRGAAAGFEVYAHLPIGDDRFWNIRRMARPVSTVDVGQFERLLLETAGGAARRRLGTAAETMPLHVAVTEALLDGQHHRSVLELLKQYPVLGRALVLSVPMQVAETADRYGQPIDELAAAGVRLASEGWSGTPDSLDLLKRHAVDYVKLTADRLLDRARLRRGAPSGGKLIDLALDNDLTVIATDVRNDEDAVALVDLGVMLMRGEHFSGPKKLKPEPEMPGTVAAS